MLIFGELVDVQGLVGENVNCLMLVVNDGDIGGLVFDVGGVVIGVLLFVVVKLGQVLLLDVVVVVKLDCIMIVLV